MLSEICGFLKNWFDLEKIFGKFRVEDGLLIWEDSPGNIGLQDGQYYRVTGSVFNNGVHKWGEDALTDEEPFNGSVWLMGVPPDLVAIAGEIEAYMAKYGGTESAAMSPYASESFGGYSYSKGGGNSGSGAWGSAPVWFNAFGPRLMRWKKL